jgi:hypothetical protein
MRGIGRASVLGDVQPCHFHLSHVALKTHKRGTTRVVGRVVWCVVCRVSLVVFEQSFSESPCGAECGLHSLYSHSGRYYDDFDDYDKGDYEVACLKADFFLGLAKMQPPRPAWVRNSQPIGPTRPRALPIFGHSSDLVPVVPAHRLEWNDTLMLAGTRHAVRDLVLAHERVMSVVLLELVPLVVRSRVSPAPTCWYMWLTACRSPPLLFV